MRWGRTVLVAVVTLLCAAAGTACGDTAGRRDGGAEAPPKLRQFHPQAAYFLAPNGTGQESDRYQTVLYAENPRGSGERNAESVVAHYDLSSLKGKVTIRRVGGGCTRRDWTVSCRAGSFYQQTSLFPFALRPVKGVPVGAAGEVEERITSANAGTVTHVRQVYVGRPDLRTDRHAPYTLPRSQRGPLPPLTPAFGNRGEIAVPGGFVLAVSLSEGTFTGERYRNCSYNRDNTAAHCRFTGQLPPGKAFETDGPFRGATDPCCWVKGSYRYSLWPAGDPPEYGSGPSPEDRRGDGRVLGLKPIDIAGLPDNGDGVLEFTSEGKPEADWTIDGITLRGRIGEQLTVPVPSARNRGPDKPDRRPTAVEMTLPQGVTLVPPQPDEQAEEEYCRYASDGRTVRCTQNPPWSSLRVRIDEKVQDARGTLRVVEPADSVDPDPSDDTAPITVQITAGTPHTGPSSTSTASTRP
ncbi:hypothetical protein ACFCVY_00630 [Streptomyces sp. NPDC056411]|uniref:hypothetical protein n=1 Tax=Streptomyces sp. NPDC056411 TaxID=3345813 RepID=UPI0035DBDF4F